MKQGLGTIGSLYCQNRPEGLYKTDLQEKLLDGVKVLLSCAHKVLAQQARPPPPALLPPIQEDREEDAT